MRWKSRNYTSYKIWKILQKTGFTYVFAFVMEMRFIHIWTFYPTPPATKREFSVWIHYPPLTLPSLKSLNPFWVPQNRTLSLPIHPKFYHFLAYHFSFISYEWTPNNFAFFEIHKKFMKYIFFGNLLSSAYYWRTIILMCIILFIHFHCYMVTNYLLLWYLKWLYQLKQLKAYGNFYYPLTF